MRFLLILLCSLLTAAQSSQPNSWLTQFLTRYDNSPLNGTPVEIEKSLYNQSSFRSYNLDLTPFNLARMQAKPIDELKVPCNFTVDYGTPQAQTFSYDSVGCGFKGSVGSLRICFDEYNRKNGNCRKLSISVDSQEFDTNTSIPKSSLVKNFRRFSFNGMPTDTSLVSERTSFFLMRELGMIAPYSVHAKLFVNGQYWGLYSMVEAVDKNFAKLRFNDSTKGEGAIFKDLWLNSLHTANPEEYRKSGNKEDVNFIREVMSAINSTSLIGDAPLRFFDRYFDVASFVNLTAFNMVVGNTDGWQQRHNFFLYVRTNSLGQKKLVFIPWDYDRLYDANSENRGAMSGRPFWDIAGTANTQSCNRPLLTPQQRAQSIGGSSTLMEWYRVMYAALPLDIDRPVTCDKFTRLAAFALKKRVQERVKYFIRSISMSALQTRWITWNDQIVGALQYDTAGPNIQTLFQGQNILYQYISRSSQRALAAINMDERMGR